MKVNLFFDNFNLTDEFKFKERGFSHFFLPSPYSLPPTPCPPVRARAFKCKRVRQGKNEVDKFIASNCYLIY